MKPRYSGDKSKDVWARIAKIESEPAHTLIYMAACGLQDHERRFLQMLIAAETDETGDAAKPKSE